MANNKKLQDKVAIITGGASGIGEATALLFAEHGARTVVIADVQDDKGCPLAEAIGLHRSTYIHCDVADENQVASLVETTCRLYGRLDVMFCNAGIANGSLQKVIDLDLEKYERLFKVNVRGTAACVKHAARAMAEGGGGSIVCTASVAAGQGMGRSADYAMTKSAVVALARCASVQLGALGVRVNSVSPEAVATPLLCGLFEGKKAEEVEDGFEAGRVLKEGFKARHVADAVLFLASEDSRFVTGHDLVVSGGSK